MRRSWKVVFRIALLALLPGTFIAISSFQQTSGSYPFEPAFQLIVSITAWTALPAVLGSWVFDYLTWRQGADDFALLDWPYWHRIAVALAAVTAPLAVIAIHAREIDAAMNRLPPGAGSVFPWGTGRYGPPTYFWWIAPSAMLAMHVVCLTIRHARRSRP